MQKRLADFVTGFGIDPEGSTVWGKPVGITSDPAGNLYISSDQVTNAVFRIEPGPLVGAFEHNLPNTVANGSDLPFRAAVTLSRFSSSDLAPTVTADLSSLGGSAREPFAAVDGGGYRLEFPMKIDGPVGAHPLIVRVEQVADGQTNELKFNRQLVVLPAVDVAIYDDDRPAPGWHVETETGALCTRCRWRGEAGISGGTGNLWWHLGRWFCHRRARGRPGVRQSHLCLSRRRRRTDV
tara:strand:- start:20 stop:733 length:714 start_codon:yes stop_codon:yes gene_type:complete